MPGCLKVIHFLLLLYHSFKSNFTRFDASIYLSEKEMNCKDIFISFQLKYELDQSVVHQQSDLDRNPRSYQQQNTGLVGNVFLLSCLEIEGLGYPDMTHGHLSPG